MQQLQSKNSISVVWKGKKFIVEINSDATLSEFGHELQKLTEVKAETMRFIVPQSSNRGSKLLLPFSDKQSTQSLQDNGILEGKPIRMMGVSENEVDEVLRNAKTDLRIAGFDEEEKRYRQRTAIRPHPSLRLPQGPYTFCHFRTLQIPGIELNPPPSEALKRMHMLAADPGIFAIMNKHRWRVGIMTEMAPLGYVGVSPKCILGFNKNHGEEISLRLRTDDLKGFRKYESIKKTLLHELAHMVYSEHDASFYALDKQLNHEAASLDWTRSRSHTLGGFGNSEQLDESFDVTEINHTTHKLGGSVSDHMASARESSVAAAYRRLTMSADRVGFSKEGEEPDPDDSNILDKPDLMDALEEGIDIEKPTRVKHDNRSAPINRSGGERRFETDFDDFQARPECYSENSGAKVVPEPTSSASEISQSIPFSTIRQKYGEPDPDDMEVSRSDPYCFQQAEILDSRDPSNINIDEPDPDDSESSVQNRTRSGSGSVVTKTMNGQGYSRNSQKEPDPDDSRATRHTKLKPDPHENLVHSLEINKIHKNEPDPDDQELQIIQDPVTVVCGRLQKAIEMLRSEVNPVEATTVLQTLFKIIRNLIEHPEDMKFKKLRKTNPTFQRNVAKYRAAMEILFLIGFNEDVMWDEIGRAETYLILKRNDPGLLWLAKSSLETCIAW